MLQRFLDPSVLASISSLELIAKTVVDGFVNGLHRSPGFGFSQEFAEYRAITPATISASSIGTSTLAAKLYLKRFRGDTNSFLTVLLDASSSMQFGSHRVNKMDYRPLSRRVAFLSRHPRPARRRRAHHLRRRNPQLRPPFHPPGPIASPARRTRTGRSPRPHRLRQAHAALLPGIPEAPRHRDHRFRFLGIPESIVRTIEPLRYNGNEVVLFHVLDPEDVRPTERPVHPRRHGDEPGDGSHARLRQKEYREKVDAHLTDLRDRAQSAGLGYFLMMTDRPLDAALREYLPLRGARK